MTDPTVSAETWPKLHVEGQFNPMAKCTSCENHMGMAPFTRYVEQAINGGPYLCDYCFGYTQAVDDAVVLIRQFADQASGHKMRIALDLVADAIAALKENRRGA